MYGEVALLTTKYSNINSSTKLFMPLFKLNSALLLSADIKRNPHRGSGFSELSFVADSTYSFVQKETFDKLAETETSIALPMPPTK